MRDKRKEKRESLEMSCKFRSFFYEIQIQGVNIKNIKREIIKELMDFFEKGKDKPCLIRFESLLYEDREYMKELLQKDYYLL